MYPNSGKMEQEIDRQVCSTADAKMLRSMKTKLSRKVRLTVYKSVYVPASHVDRIFG